MSRHESGKQQSVGPMLRSLQSAAVPMLPFLLNAITSSLDGFKSASLKQTNCAIDASELVDLHNDDVS
ncbi:hypothetical protein T03_8074 [Trichinella britovi]|uniref:Uncharacterized protein n=1 Tax=Trichinella britovi TaxID=45882 RepID=A0A0V1D5B7_TRIBR|nr:hypothetical protein T03_8074 [Trichinella britovi]